MQLIQAGGDSVSNAGKNIIANAHLIKPEAGGHGYVVWIQKKLKIWKYENNCSGSLGHSLGGSFGGLTKAISGLSAGSSSSVAGLSSGSSGSSSSSHSSSGTHTVAGHDVHGECK